MDTLTHGFVPYAAFTLARRPRVERAAAAIGGIAPDLDAFWAWLSHTHDQAYPLVHRGFSHTIWGAPILATLLLFLLAHRRVAGRFRWSESIWFTRGAIGPLWIGAWSHLFLDGLTITGVPLLWPLYDGRFTADWFFFGVPYLLPLSLFAWIMLWRAKASDRLIRRTFLALVVVLLVAGGIRWYSYPRDLLGDEDVTPGPVEWQWVVSRRNESGVLVYSTGFGGVSREPLFFPDSNRTEAAEALRLCEADIGFVPWHWYLWGIPLVNATAGDDGGWRIAYADSGIEYAQRQEPFRFWRSPAREESDPDDGGAVCLVTRDGHADFQRSRGWIGS